MKDRNLSHRLEVVLDAVKPIYAEQVREAIAEIDRLEQDRYDFEESDRQLVVLSLALCSKLRPGFECATREIAKKLSAEAMFDTFRECNPAVRPVPPPGGDPGTSKEDVMRRRRG
jgi:hypothetical protein